MTILTDFPHQTTKPQPWLASPIPATCALLLAAVDNPTRSSLGMHALRRIPVKVRQGAAVLHRNHRKKTPTDLVAAKISHLRAVTSLVWIASPCASAIKDRFYRLIMHLQVSSNELSVAALTLDCRYSELELQRLRQQTMRPTPPFRACQIRSDTRSPGLYLPSFDSPWSRILLCTAERGFPSYSASLGGIFSGYSAGFS